MYLKTQFQNNVKQMVELNGELEKNVILCKNLNTAFSQKMKY